MKKILLILLFVFLPFYNSFASEILNFTSFGAQFSIDCGSGQYYILYANDNNELRNVGACNDNDAYLYIYSGDTSMTFLIFQPDFQIDFFDWNTDYQHIIDTYNPEILHYPDIIDTVNIVGYQEMTPLPNFQYDTSTWDIIFHISTGASIPDPSVIQIWDFFAISSAITIDLDNDPRIILSIKKSDSESSLADKCSNYTVTLPPGSVLGVDGVSTNTGEIVGNFTIIGCPVIPPIDTGATNTGGLVNATLSESGTYLPILAYRNGELLLNYQGFRNAILILVMFFGTLILLYKFSKGGNKNLR